MWDLFLFARGRPRRLTHADRGLHPPRGVPGLDAHERVAAPLAQPQRHGERLAGPDVGRDGRAVPVWPDDLKVVRVLAEVVDVEAHGPGRDARAIDAEGVLARAHA